MPIEFTPPKYATIVNTLQERIADGTYLPGDMLPSETVLKDEFNTSRPTVVRALEILRQGGWIDAEQGRGRFVRAKPADARPIPAHAAGLLAEEVDGHVRVLDVARIAAPVRAASALGIGGDAQVVVRRRLVTVDGLGPVELGTAYVPSAVADGTNIGSVDPLPEGMLQHLTTRKGVRFHHATERISARPATPEEARLLQIEQNECVLTVLLTLYDQAGQPVFALDVAVPPTRHEFEDSFPIA